MNFFFSKINSFGKITFRLKLTFFLSIVETPGQRKESTVSINMTDLPQDPEIRFAKAIIEGDEEIVRQILESSLHPMENNNNVVMKNFNVSKIDSCTSDNFQEDLSFSHISPLDLAALHNQVSILDLILDYSLGK